MPFAELGFHNTGFHNVDGKGGYRQTNPGIIEITGLAVDTGKFRTPTLRSEFLQGFDVTEAEVVDLVAFLKSLTDFAFVSNPRHSDPWGGGVR